MKKLLLLFLINLVACITFAQSTQPGERVHSLKIAYISEQLELSPAVAEKFWPIYHQYEEELQSLVRERKQKNDQRSIEDILDQEQRALDIKKKYTAQFSRVLDNNQVSRLFRAEREFRQMVLRRAQRREAVMEMRERRQEHRPFRDPMHTPRMGNRPGTERPSEHRSAPSSARPDRGS